MNLFAIGRLRGGPEGELIDRYTQRLRPRLTIAELPEARGPAAVVKRQEGIALLAALPRDAFAVPLDMGGQSLDSAAFAGRLARWAALSRPVCFVIGGAEGLDHAVIARADFVLSMGTMTWPHFLVRAMLIEQLYRAQTIALGHPYHRTGRPVP